MIEEKRFYYTDVLPDEVFESREECDAAEAKELKRLEEEKLKAEKKAEREAVNIKRKKELAENVSKAQAKIDIACEEYNKARQEVRKMYNDCSVKIKEFYRTTDEKSKDILAKASAKIAEAEKEKRDAVKLYNDEFGVYKVFLTGSDAEKEYEKMHNSIMSTLTSFEPLFNTFTKNFWFD